jgi:hypothetical protein
MKTAWVTVVETKAFISRAKGRMSSEEVSSVIETLAINPLCGDLIEGTGGVRKVRFAVGGRGKSGGVRVIYYYHNPAMPLFLLSVYSKNEQANVSKATRNKMAALVRALVEDYGV